MSDKDGILLEDINHKLDIVLEATGALSDVPGQLKILESRLDQVESQTKLIPVIVAAQADQTKELLKLRTDFNDHELRLTAAGQSV